MNEIEGRLNSGINWRRIEGSGPTVVWLGGLMSDMTGSKAQALADHAAAAGRGFIRFDYLGHGGSDGQFVDGTIGRWRSDALAVIDTLTSGPLTLVGSSMGGWLACLCALARPDRVGGLLLIAPAADFTTKLMEPEMSPTDRTAMDTAGVWMRPSSYDPAGYPITRELIEESRQWQILPGPVPIKVPVRILQGGQDTDVPWQHALALANALDGEDTTFTLVRDGDHRLSRPQDIARMIGELRTLPR